VDFSRGLLQLLLSSVSHARQLTFAPRTPAPPQKQLSRTSTLVVTGACFREGGKCRVPAPTTIGPRATPHLICRCVTVRSLYVRICGTPYVCLNIILLYTPTIADVTKIAHRERVPNGAIPKIGEGPHSFMGRVTPSIKKRRLRWRCASLFHQLYCHENMLLPEYVCLTDAMPQELLDKQDLYSRYHRSLVLWYYWTRLLIKVTSFTGCKSFLKSLCVHGHIYCSHHHVLGHKYMER